LKLMMYIFLSTHLRLHLAGTFWLIS